MKYNLRGEDLLALQKAKGNICISIIVPTHRTSPDRKIDKAEVENAIDKAKQLLQFKYPRKDIKSLLQSLDDQLKDIDFIHNTEGLGLYISSEVKLLVHFPFPVMEKIMVDDNFEIRDLLYKINYDQPYYVLMLTEKIARLFEGSWNNLFEIKEDHWPLKYEDEYAYSKPVRSSSFAGHAHVKMFEKDKSELEAIRFENFYRQLDRGLDTYLRKNTSLIILAPEKESSWFEKVSKHKENIIHKVNGSYSYNNLKSVSDIVWPVMYEHLQSERNQLINEFKEMIGGHRGLSGIQNVWEAAKEGKAFKLLVEKDYRCPGFVTDNDYNLYLRSPKAVHKILPDAVDELIETVLQENGKVYFTDNDLLKDYSRIALITRY
jgi:hypothetical protein